MGVEIDIVYEGNLHCSAVHSQSGTKIMTDAPLDNGGKGEAFSPTDLVATATGTCIVTIMGLAANKFGIDIEGTKIHVTKTMTAVPQRMIGEIKVVLTMPEGKEYTDKEKTILKNAANSCPVKQSLHEEVKVIIEFIYP